MCDCYPFAKALQQLQYLKSGPVHELVRHTDRVSCYISSTGKHSYMVTLDIVLSKEYWPH